MFITSIRTGNGGGSVPFKNYKDAICWLEQMTDGKNAEIKIWQSDNDQYLLDTKTTKRKRLAIVLKEEQNNIRNQKIHSITNNINNNMTKNKKQALSRMSEDEAMKYAAKIKHAAIEHRDSNDVEFINSIIDASDGLITFSKCSNGRQVSFSECRLFKETHNKKHPGRIAYEKIDSAVMDIYHSLCGTVVETQDTCISSDCSRITAKELIDKLSESVLAHYYADEEIKSYFRSKHITLEDDVTSYTNSVLSCHIENESIIFRNIAERSIKINDTSDKSKDDLKCEIIDAIMKLLISSAISTTCRTMLSKVVETDTIEELLYEENQNKNEELVKKDTRLPGETAYSTLSSEEILNLTRIIVNETLVGTNDSLKRKREYVLKELNNPRDLLPSVYLDNEQPKES